MDPQHSLEYKDTVHKYSTAVLRNRVPGSGAILTLDQGSATLTSTYIAVSFILQIITPNPLSTHRMCYSPVPKALVSILAGLCWVWRVNILEIE
jgi:hypothetical protein